MEDIQTRQFHALEEVLVYWLIDCSCCVAQPLHSQSISRRGSSARWRSRFIDWLIAVVQHHFTKDIQTLQFCSLEVLVYWLIDCCYCYAAPTLHGRNPEVAVCLVRGPGWLIDWLLLCSTTTSRRISRRSSTAHWRSWLAAATDRRRTSGQPPAWPSRWPQVKQLSSMNIQTVFSNDLNPLMFVDCTHYAVHICTIGGSIFQNLKLQCVLTN